MKVILVGSGGREHALAVGIARSPLCDELHCAPGNPGIATVATCHPVRADDAEGLLDLANALRPGLVVIGPEGPLVAGVGDVLRHAGFPVFGPGEAAARLEGSKAFAKEVMLAAGVPTARHATCSTLADARAAIDAYGGAVVVKADGLAAGKGVSVCADAAEALEAATACLAGAFGDAGATVLIEERLHGPEVSLLALCDGEALVPLPAAQDAKRLGDGDAGPNTGGMGAYSPVPGLDDGEAAALCESVHVPVLRELARRGLHFNGCLYAGLMLTPDGPRVLEFNVRWGDPETQAIVPRLDGDVCAGLLGVAQGVPDAGDLRTSSDACVAVGIAVPGYPSAPRTGAPIAGIERAERLEGVSVFHAGTALAGGELVTAAGRVLTVSARAATLELARERAYAAASEITFDGAQMRSDIALGAVHHEREAAHVQS